jgi:hypothetical protein
MGLCGCFRSVPLDSETEHKLEKKNIYSGKKRERKRRRRRDQTLLIVLYVVVDQMSNVAREEIKEEI